MTELLDTITSLSHEFGGPDYVKAGGGNTSCKAGDSLWIKPSGTTLLGLAPETFVKMRRSILGGLYRARPPADVAERERWVQEAMAAAVDPATPGRASVEAPLHDSFDATYVVHTHPAIVNGLTCALGGEAAAKELFPDALWMPYIDPGYTLCMQVRRALEERRARGGEPAITLLGNHGVFVAGNTADEIRATYARLFTTLRDAYAAAGVDTGLLFSGPPPSAESGARVQAAARDALGGEAAFLAAGAPTAFAAGPFSPDHIVYAKAFPFEGALRPDAFRFFAEARGYAPRLVATPDGFFGLGATRKTADLALVLGQDGALVRQLTAAFGGPRYLDDRSRLFIENWEVEAYRARQA